MRVSLNWLRELVDFDLGPDELAERFTLLGLEIESVHRLGEGLSNIVVGEIQSIEPHPSADRLVVCKTQVGQGDPVQIVCGATNMKAGDRVPTALIGATLPGDFKIEKRKMRGVESQGMMCSARELGLGDDHAGLLILDKSFDIGANALPLLGLDDVILEIEVTPNRGDWAGMIGIARELAAYFKTEFRIPDVTLSESQTQASAVSSVTIEDPERCPRYAGRVLRNVGVASSPQWLKQRLVAAGQRPINNIVDITNFVLLETGHPLHGFDFDKLAENRIVVRCAKPAETIRAIDGVERKLDSDMLVIADARDPVAIAGVMGGIDSEVGEGTASVFLESAYFAPASIRKTARALIMNTEASARFQRGADPAMVPFACNRAAQLMQEVCGAEVLAGIIDVHPNPTKPRNIALHFARTKALLGTAIAAEDQRAIMNRLGFQTTDANNEAATFAVPTWRPDAHHEADLIEEIARLHGYDNIPVTLPRVHRREEVLAPEAAIERQLRQKLVHLGLTEVCTLTFSSTKAIEQAGLQYAPARLVRLQNPISELHEVMRPSLIPGMLDVASRNLRRGQERLRLFELGPTFTSVDGHHLADEIPHLVLALAGNANPTHWDAKPRAVDFFDAKGLLEALLQGTVELALRPAETPPFEIGNCAEIILDGTVQGYIGQVAQPTLAAIDIDIPVFLINLNLTSILQKPAGIATFTELPKFPPALRDLAVVVDEATHAADIQRTAQEAGGKRLQRVDIFDVYKGGQIPPGRKSIALSLLFQSPERTLTDKDTDKDCRRILDALAAAHQAELR